jgi:hypothetical protein
LCQILHRELNPAREGDGNFRRPFVSLKYNINGHMNKAKAAEARRAFSQLSVSGKMNIIGNPHLESTCSLVNSKLEKR